MTRAVYLDNASTTPPDPAAVAAMVACEEEAFGNPASPHGHGLDAARGVPFHPDACQSFCRVADEEGGHPGDLVSNNAHKVHGPKGVGALVVRAGARPAPLLHGGGQEGGLRPGTVNVPGVAGFAAALEAADPGGRREERGAAGRARGAARRPRAGNAQQRPAARTAPLVHQREPLVRRVLGEVARRGPRQDGRAGLARVGLLVGQHRAEPRRFLNFLSVDRSMRFFGFTHYHVEAGKMVRQGLMTRDEALDLLRMDFDRAILDDVLRKLGCGREG